VQTKSGHFKPEESDDHYEDALKELLKKKQLARKSSVRRSESQPRSSVSWMRCGAACKLSVGPARE
jgi:non-homologous end joining protein Ku